MKVFIIANIICSFMLALVNSCTFLPDFLCREKWIDTSDRRQFKCLLDSPSLDNDLFHIQFKEQEATYRCRVLEDNDPDHNSSPQYPAVPEMIDNSETFAAAHVGGTQLVVCVNTKATSEEMAQMALKGYIVASDMKKKKNYVCVDNTKIGGRISRRMSRSC